MVSDLIERLALGLEASDIPYMLIGGQAVAVHGEARFTRDIDVTLGVGPERLTELLDLVKDLQLEVQVESPKDFVGRTMVLPCHDPASGMGVDFVFLHSVYERQAIDRAHVVPLGKASVRFVSVEDLVIHKIVAGRPRDLEDVRNVLLKNPEFDRSYVEKWLRDFTRDLGEPYSQRFAGVLKALPK